MAIADKLTKLATDITNAYDAIDDKGGTLPANKNTDNLENAIRSIESGGTSEFSPDWAELGYEETPQAIIDRFNYAKEIKENWNASVTDLQNKFGSDDNLMYMPIVDTSNVTNMMNMFNNCINLMMFPQLNTSNVTNMMGMFTSCRNLVEIPQIDTSKLTNAMSMCSNCRKLVKVPLINTSNLTNAGNMFSSCISLTTVPKLDFRKVTYIYGVFENCRNLSEASLNNILAMCAESNISSASSKTLKQIGLTSDQATICQGLSNWAACEAAEWTTGY